MAIQDLKIWASSLNTDITNSSQRRNIELEEFIVGWLRNDNISFQQLNQLFFLLTSYANPWPNPPVPYPTTLPIPEDALEMNGQAITIGDYPNLFAAYGANLPDISAEAPTGHTYIVRKS